VAEPDRAAQRDRRRHDLDQALASVPGQLARGFGTICVKPSQFLDETAGISAFCRSLAEKAAALCP
jgi:hypothetical protein